MGCLRNRRSYQERFRGSHPDAESEIFRFHPDNPQHLAREDSKEKSRHPSASQAIAATGGLLLRPPHPPAGLIGEQCIIRRSQEGRQVEFFPKTRIQGIGTGIRGMGIVRFRIVKFKYS